MLLGDGRYSVQEVVVGEVAVAAAADDSGGPVECEGLEVDLNAGEEDVVVGVDGAEGAASAGAGDNLDVERRVDGQGNLGAGKGLAVDLVANPRGKLDQG